jgi:hypothetical protein
MIRFPELVCLNKPWLCDQEAIQVSIQLETAGLFKDRNPVAAFKEFIYAS